MKLTGLFNVRLVDGGGVGGVGAGRPDPEPAALFPPPSLKSHLFCLGEK